MVYIFFDSIWKGGKENEQLVYHFEKRKHSNMNGATNGNYKQTFNEKQKVTFKKTFMKEYMMILPLKIKKRQHSQIVNYKV